MEDLTLVNKATQPGPKVSNNPAIDDPVYYTQGQVRVKDQGTVCRYRTGRGRIIMDMRFATRLWEMQDLLFY